LGRGYLKSRDAANRVAERLEAAYGGPVRVDEVNLGFGGCTFRKVELFEAGAAPSDPPWMVIDEATTDTSVLDLYSGTIPSQLNLNGVNVPLRFDKNNTLLTCFPKPTGPAESLPHFHMENGRVTVRQEGRADFVVRGLRGDLCDEEGQLVFAAVASDP